MINQLTSFVVNLFRPSGKVLYNFKKEELPSKKLYKAYYAFQHVDDLPDSVADHVIYYVGDKEFKWLAAFKCPCGCGALIQLNLLKHAYPQWRIKVHDNGDVSIYPSINRKVNCKSHFNITRNSVRWWEWLDNNY